MSEELCIEINQLKLRLIELEEESRYIKNMIQEKEKAILKFRIFKKKLSQIREVFKNQIQTH